MLVSCKLKEFPNKTREHNVTFSKLKITKFEFNPTEEAFFLTNDGPLNGPSFKNPLHMFDITNKI